MKSFWQRVFERVCTPENVADLVVTAVKAMIVAVLAAAVKRSFKVATT